MQLMHHSPRRLPIRGQATSQPGLARIVLTGQPVESTIGGMRSRDLPHNRSLDDSREPPSGVDGSARPPAELLDNLRLRLSQLPENHPSAFRQAYDSREGPAETPADSMSPQDSADESRGSTDAGVEVGVGTSQDDGPAPGGGSLADLIRAISDTSDSLAETIGEGMLGDIGTLPRGIHSEPYRPWFMSGDPGVPWFAVDGVP
jgi:hypothetical protein